MQNWNGCVNSTHKDENEKLYVMTNRDIRCDKTEVSALDVLMSANAGKLEAECYSVVMQEAKSQKKKMKAKSKIYGTWIVGVIKGLERGRLHLP